MPLAIHFGWPVQNRQDIRPKAQHFFFGIDLEIGRPCERVFARLRGRRAERQCVRSRFRYDRDERCLLRRSQTEWLKIGIFFEGNGLKARAKARERSDEFFDLVPPDGPVARQFQRPAAIGRLEINRRNTGGSDGDGQNFPRLQRVQRLSRLA